MSAATCQSSVTQLLSGVCARPASFDSVHRWLPKKRSPKEPTPPPAAPPAQGTGGKKRTPQSASEWRLARQRAGNLRPGGDEAGMRAIDEHKVINNLFLVVNFGISNNLCIVSFIIGGCYWLFAC